MRKRQIYLFLCFFCLSVLFALFQNFSLPKKNVLDKFIPEYRIRDYIGDLEAPSGFVDYIEEKSVETTVLFDHKQFLKKTLKESPAYKALKDYMDVTDDSISTGTCYDSNGEATLCPTQQSRIIAQEKEEVIKSMKVRANPSRREASLRLNTMGNINSDLNYCVEDQNISLRLKQNIGTQSNIQLKMDSKDQSGSLQWNLNW